MAGCNAAIPTSPIRTHSCCSPANTRPKPDPTPSSGAVRVALPISEGDLSMSVLISDLRYYGSANMPEADGATVGGAIDFTKRLEFADQLSGTSTYAVVSS